jgi:molybdenum cofactor synthesis domain-containing protein
MRLGILTVSDACSAGEREDRSGALLVEWAEREDFSVARRAVVPDDRLTITRTLLTWIDSGAVDAVFTTGGTGFGPRDVTPEATRPVLEREAPGLAERVRRLGEASTVYASLSRGLVGERGGVFVANLPGSPGGVSDGLEVLGALVRHVVALLGGGRPSHVPPSGADA